MSTPATLRIGVIGCGHWGPNHIRTFSTLEGSTVTACADPDAQRLKTVNRLFPAVRGCSDYRQLLADPEVDAVVVATPTGTHFEITRAALLAGKHALVEKPLTLRVAEAEALRRLARTHWRTLMVGHTFLFNTGIRKLKECVASGDIGRVYYLHSTRTNLGPVRKDVGAVRDLAAHDVAIFNYLLDAEPLEVSARGERFIRREVEDVAFISLSYPGRVLANIHVSWLDPKKVRQIVVTGSKKMLSWDDLAATGPVMIYDKGVFAVHGGVYKEPYYVNYGDFQLLTKEGDVTIPHLKLEEPLRAEARHFLDCIRGAPNTLSGPKVGIAVVRALAAIQDSMDAGGKPVKVR
ncbi:MAG: Gfo/Idh/MocA family oxidoreductase [Verrucomicrobia bacterium]|nr:Gfo/Idh/MocA family oxidoreductase [Verrucomicrobiota bacterium]